ncbi:GNAT family N-acetyltransferase [Aliiglaciecola sp. LCG003]|nr:GNAT family N-acetyltransferase [Aliiglaciecola sp. LCG003]WJG11349.1 GNAT family N-acetyltransferase [Aliiglaciecola sp. LCG003]
MILQQESPLSSDVIELLKAHHREMFDHSPRGSVHALDESQFNSPHMTFWSVRVNQQLAGCGALKTIDEKHGEIKAMRTAKGFERQGVATTLLENIITQAQIRGCTRVSLETGSMAFFAPARQLYLRRGFKPCPPFAGYFDDPNSICMTLTLD